MTEKVICPVCKKPFTPTRKGQKYCSRDCQVRARRRPDPLVASTIVVIPDTQVKQGVPNDHLRWINQWMHRYDGKPLTIVHLGDHWDMPSLSSYDRGKGAMEGRRYRFDVDSGNRGMEILSDGWDKQKQWRRVLLRGNHEDRISRAIESDIQLEGLLSLDDLKSPSWEVHQFLEVVDVNGVLFSHYFYNPMTGRPYGGENLLPRLKTIGRSFVMGHQQTYLTATRFLPDGTRQRAVVAGACYQHDEDYKGPQGNAHWRGVLILNNVEDGSFDLNEVSLDYLCRRFEGHRLTDHKGVEL